MKHDAISALASLVESSRRWLESDMLTVDAAVSAGCSLRSAVDEAILARAETFLEALRAAIDASSPTIDGDTLDQEHPARFIPAVEWTALEEALGTRVPPDPAHPLFDRAAKEGF